MSRGPRPRTPPELRSAGALTLALAALATSAALGSQDVRDGEDGRPNVIVVLTDDQRADTIPLVLPVMPFLQARAMDTADRWTLFTNAFVNTPLCCPSRANALAGAYAHHTGVLSNDDAARFDERSTLATWLDAAGYHTGLVGKYLNGYPAGRPPYVPEGWDRWWARQHGDTTTLYHGYTLIEQGTAVRYGSRDEDYLTDVLAAKAIEFIRTSPSGRPFFLWFAPTAPHPPWIAPERHRDAFAGMPVPVAPSVGERDVSDKPAWVRGLHPLAPERLERLRDARRRAHASLLAVDDAIRAIVQELRIRDELDQTVLVVTSDNGFAFGEHRWVKKSCPYTACLRVPLLVRMPGTTHRVEDAMVSTVDLAPTIVELAGASPTASFDGTSLVSLLRTGSRRGRPGEIYAEFAGDDTIPAWWQVRTPRLAYIELATGERELYALATDPHELVNVADEPGYADAVERLAVALDAYRSS